MHFPFARFFSMLALLALAACADGNVIPGSAPAFAGDVAANAADPCTAFSKGGWWDFRGPCLDETVKKRATIFKLATYKGIAETLEYPRVSGSLSANTPLMTGEGTGRSDITRTYLGHKFPLFGTVPCIDKNNNQIPCSGKAVVYDLLVNNASSSSNDVTFAGSPSVSLTAAAALKSMHSCTIYQMGPEGGFLYQTTPVIGIVKGGRVKVPSHKVPFLMYAQTVKVFAISCK